MTDPLEPSPEHRARMDQLRAGMREMSETLGAAVDELVAAGWTDAQARALVVHAVTSDGRS